MNPSFSNAPISNLLEATRSTELRLARNHAVLSFCVGAPPMASLKTLSVMRHRHLCPCLSTMPKAIPSNSISNPSFKRDKGISCSSGRPVTIAESSPSWLAMRHASAGRVVRMFCPRTQRRGRRSRPHRHRIRSRPPPCPTFEPVCLRFPGKVIFGAETNCQNGGISGIPLHSETNRPRGQRAIGGFWHSPRKSLLRPE